MSVPAQVTNPYSNKKRRSDVTNGHATSTVQSRDSAIEMFNRIMREEDEPQFHELSELDAEGDNLKTVIIRFANGVGNDSCLKSNGEEYSPSTLWKHIEWICSRLDKKFPNNQALADKGWMDDLKESLPKLVGRRTNKGISEDDVISNCIPIFRKAAPANAIYVDPQQECVAMVQTD